MAKDTNFLERIREFLLQASEIGDMCNDENVYWSEDNFLAGTIHSKYVVWKIHVAEYLYTQKLLIEADLFVIHTGVVPALKGGLDYGNKNSFRSRDLIKKVQIELSEKVKDLVRLLEKKQDQSKRNSTTETQPNPRFYFDRLDGKLYRHPASKKGEGCSFITTDGRFRLIEVLIEEKVAGEHYLSTKVLMKKTQYRSTKILRGGITGIRKKVGKTFIGVKGNEFIQGKQSEGYRIGEKIEIDFRDTP